MDKPEILHIFNRQSTCASFDDLQGYHDVKPYHKENVYRIHVYLADLNHEKRRYQNELITTEDTGKCYVVAVQSLEKKKYRELAKSCQCEYHLKSMFNIWRLWDDLDKLGCLQMPQNKSRNALHEKVIDATLAYTNET
jgi:hypothetical protein